MGAFDPVDKATDDTTGVQCASANILAVADADSSMNLAVSVASTLAITMLMY